MEKGSEFLSERTFQSLNMLPKDILTNDAVAYLGILDVEIVKPQVLQIKSSLNG